MNRIHRVIFSRLLGARVVVHEKAGSRGRGRQRGAALLCVAILLGGLCASPALAAGGAGGQGASNGNVANPGGAGGTRDSLNGANGADASPADGNTGGGGGGGEASRTSVQGGAGGLGGAYAGALANGGDGGRAGDAGAIQNGTIGASIVGGAGQFGAGGIVNGGTALSGGGGGGGVGGVGLIVASGGSASISAGVTVTGGVGGNGGEGGGTIQEGAYGSGGAGGDGGVGVYLASGTTLVNRGTIAGGFGGFGGPPGARVQEKVNAVAGNNGAGGVGIEADGGSIVNSGTIRSALIGGSAARSAAVYFRSGVNQLELQSGSVIDGAIDIGANARATILAATSGLNLNGGVIVQGAGVFDTNGFDLEVGSTVSGGGTLAKTGAGTLLLSVANTFTGDTTVNAGTLRAGAAGAFGAVGAMAVDANGTLDLNGYSQSVGSLAGNGVVAFGPANAQTPADGPTLTVGSNGRDTVFGGQIAGNGNLVKVGTGALTLGGANAYDGATRIDQGTLRASAANAFSAASAHEVAAGATLDAGGFSQTVASLRNAGVVSLLSAAPGATLTVNGAYVGNGGSLRLGTQLGDSGSVSDRLVLNGPGATATGTTNVQITNLGGLGAPTLGNGIEVIGARNGATTTAQASRNAFALAGGHVDAGAFEYRLYAADANGLGENWYLRSTVVQGAPGSGTGGGGAGTGSGTGDSGTGTGTGGIGFGAGGVIAGAGSFGVGGAVGVPAYRAEVPLYSALPQQLRQASLGMLGNRVQRIGDEDEAGPGAAPSGGRRAWGRVITQQQDLRQSGTVSPTSEGRFSGFQAGTDLWADGAWRAGVYAGQLDGELGVSGFSGGQQGRYVGRNDLRNQYLGGYATWASDGFYADAVLQLGRHRFDVEPTGGLAAHAKARSTLASLEVGKSFAFAEGWKIEPQVQLVHQRLDIDDVGISGARVLQDPDNGWLLRAGVRVVGDMATGAGRLKPYARLNVYRASKGNDTATFAGPAGSTSIQAATGSVSTEAAGGLTLAVSEATSLYAELGRRWASGSDARIKSSLQGSLGLRVRW